MLSQIKMRTDYQAFAKGHHPVQSRARVLRQGGAARHAHGQKGCKSTFHDLLPINNFKQANSSLAFDHVRRRLSINFSSTIAHGVIAFVDWLTLT